MNFVGGEWLSEGFLLDSLEGFIGNFEKSTKKERKNKRTIPSVKKYE
jgi:hypothetical protein